MINAVIFDLGGVVLEWVPERAFEQVLPSGDIAGFLERIDFKNWNRRNDGGRRFEAAEAELIERFPDDADAVRAYREHFHHALTGMVPGTSAIIAELGRAGLGLTALTNWSGETFPIAYERFGILRRFTDILVSGDEGLLKPDPAIFALACERAALDPATTAFIDDGEANVEAANEFGLTGLRFIDAERLRADLVRLGLIGEPEPIGRPIFHFALAAEWEAAVATGEYAWSSRGETYDQEGFVHCSFADQVDRTRTTFYADLTDEDLVLLELDPDHSGVPVILEPGGSSTFPHVFAPLPVGALVPHPGSWRP